MRLVQKTAQTYESADGYHQRFAGALFRRLVQPGQAQKGLDMSSFLRETFATKVMNVV